MIKKIALMALMAGFAGQSFAGETAACTTTTAASGGKTDITGSSTAFIKTTFPQVCSSNVLMGYDQSTTKAWVGAASLKGKNSFKGHTDGGAPKKHAACVATAGGCDATDVTNAWSQAQTDAGT